MTDDSRIAMNDEEFEASREAEDEVEAHKKIAAADELGRDDDDADDEFEAHLKKY